nr:hypothetical protein [Tanacetum cinerariifolium]
MINLIKNGDQPLPRITQVSISRTSSTEQTHLKDKSMCNKTSKDLWDALARHMIGSEYGEQDRKAVVLSKEKVVVSYSKGSETDDFNELKKITALLAKAFNRRNDSDQEINANMVFMAQIEKVLSDFEASSSSADEKISEKCGYSKDNCELSFKFLNNLQPEWKQSKEKVVVSSDSKGSEADDFSELKKITALLAKKQEFVKTDNKRVEKKDDEKKRDVNRVKCYNYKKEGHFAKDCKKAKVKDYEYYKTKMLLAKKDKDEQVLLAEDQAWMESSSDSDQEINTNSF